jgi:DNA-binding PadR family transcriptional regulator
MAEGSQWIRGGAAAPVAALFLDKAAAVAYIVDIMSDVLGPFEQAVLLGLVRLRDQAYGRAILKEVEARLGREVAVGAVYATLERLEAKRLITSEMGSGTPVRGGRARRFYSIHGPGVRALNDSRAALEGIWQGILWPLRGGA